MKHSTPDEVLQAVSRDIKLRGLSRKEAAERIGLGSSQSYSNLIASHKYLNFVKARKLSDAFGYNEEFLTTGKGELLPSASPIEESVQQTSVSPQSAADDRYKKLRADMMQAFIWLNSFVNFRGDEETSIFLQQIWNYFKAEEFVRADMRRNGTDESQFETLLEERIRDVSASITETIDKHFQASLRRAEQRKQEEEQ